MATRLGEVRGYSALADDFLVGFTLLVTCVSLWYARGRTVSLIAFPALLLLWWALRNKEGTPLPRASLRSIVGDTFLIVGSCFAPVVWSRWCPDCYWWSGIPHADDLFFGQLGTSLVDTGCENIRPYLDYFSRDGCGVVPYHYAELWVSGFLSRGLGLPGPAVFILLVCPLLAAGCLLGLWALAEGRVHLGFVERCALALFLLLSPPLISGLSKWRALSEIEAFVIPLYDLRAGAGKLLVIGLLFLAGLRALDRGHAAVAVGWTLLLAPWSANGAPAALGAAMFALILQRKSSASLMASACAIVSTVVGLPVFYNLLGDRSVAMWSLTEVFGSAFSGNGLRVQRNILVKSLFQLLVVFLPFVAALGALWRRDVKTGSRFGLFATGAVLGGVFGYMVLYRFGHAVEFATLAPALALQLSGIAAGLALASGMNVQRWSFVVVLLALGIAGLRVVGVKSEFVEERSIVYSGRYSRDYLETLAAFYPASPFGGYLVHTDDVPPVVWDATKPLPTLWPTTYPLGAFAGLLPQYRTATMLNGPAPAWDQRRYQMAPFAQYLQKHPGPVWRAQRAFIEEFRLGFLVASRNVQIPEMLAPMLKLVAQDQGTGERVFEVIAGKSNQD